MMARLLTDICVLAYVRTGNDCVERISEAPSPFSLEVEDKAST